ncbi:paired amphipathic helix protein Sin3-like 3 [Rosa rugosa]|uniref:paired amphipathic helix protein Sin3-like 3 n=1 Tax=Rosa rugosa TaxID=74645 RepID=UPI002B415AD8|nr:paired amphipathic helix protein Sin3-like 3 [Rosa rugosa]
MVPLPEKEYSAEPRMMKEKSAGEEASSTKASWEKRSLEFIDSLRNFPWFKEYQNLMKDYKNKEIDLAILVEKMVELFKGRPELIAGFNKFLPETYQITIPAPTLLPRVRIVCQKRKRSDDSASDSGGGAKDSKIRKVIRCDYKTKGRFHDEDKESDEGHHVFLGHESPTLSPRPRITVLSNKAKNDDDSTTDCDDAGSIDSKLRKVIAFVNKVEERFRSNNDDGGDDDDTCQSHIEFFLDMVCKRNKSSPNRSIDADEEELQIYKKVATLLEGHSDLIDEFTQFLTEVPRVDSIIDFRKCKTCTPSYRLLPKNLPIPGATKRSKLASEVLNDRWVCVNTSPSTTSSTSRGGGRRINRKSQHEQDLLDWEEEKYEHDMLEEYVNSVANNIAALIKEIKNESPTEIYLEEHLTEMNLRCIERLYGLRGRDMVDLLKNNIQAVLPVILRRLKQKQKELKRKRSDLKQEWAHLFPE